MDYTLDAEAGFLEALGSKLLPQAPPSQIEPKSEPEKAQENQ